MSSTAFFLKRLNDHVLYLKKIKLTLNNRGDFCGSDYHRCKLGEWLYGEGKEQARNISDEMLTLFESLFDPHQQFHDASAIAITAHNEGNRELETTQFTKMHTLSNTLVSILLDMDRIAQSSSVEVA